MLAGNMVARAITIHPMSGHLGAEVEGVDLSHFVDDGIFEQVHQAFLDHGVIVLRNQELSREGQIDFGRRFGELDVHPIVVGMKEHPEIIELRKPAGERVSFGTSWHSDNSFFAEPSQASILYGVTIPPYGGDTLWASMERAYDALSPGMQKLLEGLDAVHSARRAYDPAVTGAEKYEKKAAINYEYSAAVYEEVEHPVIRTHPETGRKSIYVNATFTDRVVGLSRAESDAILRFLYEHATRPEFTCRLRWEPGTVAIWDNRATQHYALGDYTGFDRLMYRVSVAGNRPF